MSKLRISDQPLIAISGAWLLALALLPCIHNLEVSFFISVSDTMNHSAPAFLS